MAAGTPAWWHSEEGKDAKDDVHADGSHDADVGSLDEDGNKHPTEVALTCTGHAEEGIPTVPKINGSSNDGAVEADRLAAATELMRKT